MEEEKEDEVEEGKSQQGGEVMLCFIYANTMSRLDRQ